MDFYLFCDRKTWHPFLKVLPNSCFLLLGMNIFGKPITVYTIVSPLALKNLHLSHIQNRFMPSQGLPKSQFFYSIKFKISFKTSFSKYQISLCSSSKLGVGEAPSFSIQVVLFLLIYNSQESCESPVYITGTY